MKTRDSSSSLVVGWQIGCPAMQVHAATFCCMAGKATAGLASKLS